MNKVSEVFVLSAMNHKYESTGSVSTAIEFAINMKPKYVSRPIKPSLSSKHTTDDVLAYANSLKEYDSKLVKYNTEREENIKMDKTIDSAIELFIKNVSGLNSIPLQYRDKVYNKAYQDGHSSGYYSVYQHLDELVGIFT